MFAQPTADEAAEDNAQINRRLVNRQRKRPRFLMIRRDETRRRRAVKGLRDNQTDAVEENQLQNALATAGQERRRAPTEKAAD